MPRTDIRKTDPVALKAAAGAALFCAAILLGFAYTANLIG